MNIWKVKYAADEVSPIVENVYTVQSATLTGAIKKAKRLDDEWQQAYVDAGEDPSASVLIGVELIACLDA